MIQLQGVGKAYESKSMNTLILSDISLNINRGEFVVIIGRSGCGKTTLLNILGCTDSLTSGQFFFNGVNMSDLKGKQLASFRNKNVGYVFQEYHLIGELSAIHNVELPLGYAGVKRKKRKKRAEDVLKKVGLEDRMRYYPSQLSGGQQQRVAMARAIINEPEVLLADEPTGNLDEKSRQDIMKLLETINKMGTTIIMVTHDKELMQYATKIIEIANGTTCELTGGAK